MRPGTLLPMMCTLGPWVLLFLTNAEAKRNGGKKNCMLRVAGVMQSNLTMLHSVPHQTPLQVRSPGATREGPHHYIVGHQDESMLQDAEFHTLVRTKSFGPQVTQESLSNALESIDKRLGNIEDELMEEQGNHSDGNGKDSNTQNPIWSMISGKGKRKKPCVLSMSQEKIVSVTTASLLIAFVAFTMCIVYMMNFPDKQVQSYSAKMMSSVISILCAVLIEKAQFGCFFNGVVIKGIFGGGDWGVGIFLKEFCVNFGIFLLWVMSISVFMKRNRDSHHGMFATNQLLSHEAAFVGIEMIIAPQAELFEMQQDSLGFYPTLGCYLASFAGASVLLLLITRFTGFVRKKVTKREQETLPEAATQQPALPRPGDEVHAQAHGEQHLEDDFTQQPTLGSHAAHSHGEPHWVHESEEAEEECAAILLSLMTRQTILFAILGRVPTKKGDFGMHIRSDFGFLFLAIVVTMVLLNIASRAYYSCEETSWLKPKLVFLKHYLAFTVGWLILSLSRWSVQMAILDKTLMFISNAVALSVPLVLAIILIDFLCDEGWMSENSAIIFISCAALCIGLSWEMAFACSIDTINKETGNSLFSDIAVEVGMCLGLCLLLLPGWKAFVVPKAADPVPIREISRRLTNSTLSITGGADKGP